MASDDVIQKASLDDANCSDAKWGGKERVGWREGALLYTFRKTVRARPHVISLVLPNQGVK